MLNRDPLKISYIVVHADDRLDEMSPFQGFGSSWPATRWALRLLVHAPASMLERAWPLDGLIAQRMGGANRLAWLPLSISALEHLKLADIAFSLVLLSGNDEVAKRVDAWLAKQPRPVLHTRKGEVGSQEQAIAWCETTLREHCRVLVDEHGDQLSGPRREAARDALERWNDREPIPIEVAQVGHNISAPNEMVLIRAGRTFPAGEPFIGDSEEEYDTFAVGSARAVLDVRDAVGLRDYNRLYRPVPGLVLTEPAFYRPHYARVRHDPGFATKPMIDALRRLQKQTGLWNTIDGKSVTDLMDDPKAQALVAARQEELAIHCHGVGLMAAQTCSAVLRMRPAVNHVFPSLSRFARNIRATSDGAKFKTPKLFDEVQGELAAAVGEARIELIAGYEGSIRIVADAPLELLPVGNLPLGLRFDTCRTNATPGNLMMGELVGRTPVTVFPADLCKVLVVSGFADKDPIRDMMKKALDSVSGELIGRVEVAYARVQSRAELVAALNGSDATILVFDGHGTLGGADAVGGIIVGDEQVNVWELRGEARIPPIVILSACDTQGMDAPSHATVGNGFLACGAMTVLATLLPIGGREGAVFIARLLLRLGQFIPALLKARVRAVEWIEVVSGLLRMTLATETVDAMVKDRKAGMRLKAVANIDINSGHPEWYDRMLVNIAAASGLEEAAVRRRARGVLARSEAIRYVQLGSPEAITIDDGAISSQFFPPALAEAIGVE